MNCTDIACTRHSRSPPSCCLGMGKADSFSWIWALALPCPAMEQWLYPKSRQEQADNPRDLQGSPPSSIRHPGYHVGYGWACVHGQKRHPLRQVSVGCPWLAGNA